MSTTQETAIVLHGPPTAGKTELSREIQRRYEPGTVRLISLDDGWLPGEFRYVGGTGRYADLRQAREPILVVELGCGEPPDLTFPGATRAAAEWVNVLRSSGRAIFPFLLWAEWDDAANRLMQRHQRRPDTLFWFWQQIGLYALYEHQHPLASFPATPGFQEERVVTSARTVGEVAEEILRRSGLL